jgi:hypothetical protein
MKAALTAATSWTERYEALRHHVLEGRHRLQAQPLGLALWVGQGMAGWMKQWRELITTPAPPIGLPAPALGPAGGDWQEQLTCVLAQMTLANLQARKIL